jgi:hypothetical protein
MSTLVKVARLAVAALFFNQLVALPPVAAEQGDASEVLTLWGAQGGPWKGHIDIYGPESPDPQSMALTTRWDAVPDFSVLTKIETFGASAGDFSAVTVMFADAEHEQIVTPYFSGGRQRDYRFSVVSVEVLDDTHWSTVIGTAGAQETYEERPAILRYLRKRDGNVIENTKEVRFLDDAGGGYELRSFIRQTLSP